MQKQILLDKDVLDSTSIKYTVSEYKITHRMRTEDNYSSSISKKNRNELY